MNVFRRFLANRLFRFLFIFVAMVFGMQLAPATAQACKCIADPFSKQYVYYKKTWYGTKRKWTCLYTCQDHQQKQVKLTGTHEDWYVSDKGLEGICDGLHYVNQYSTARMEFIWNLDEARHFDASESSSRELKSWNQQSCR